MSAQRTLAGQRGLQLTAGTVNGLNMNTNSSNFAFHAELAFSQYVKNANKWVFGAQYLEKDYPYKSIKIPQSQFTVDGGYYLNFLSDAHKIFFMSVGASIVGGYETVNWNNKLLFDGATINNKDNFLYGGTLTLEAEAYLTNCLVLVANARERYLEGSSIGKLNTLFSLGFKFIIN
jgi:hypothetical protein